MLTYRHTHTHTHIYGVVELCMLTYMHIQTLTYSTSHTCPKANHHKLTLRRRVSAELILASLCEATPLMSTMPLAGSCSSTPLVPSPL